MGLKVVLQLRLILWIHSCAGVHGASWQSGLMATVMRNRISPGMAYHLGKRDTVATDTFIGKLRYATAASRYQLTSDGFKPYVKAVQMLLRDRVDFAQLVKVYGTSREPEPQCIEHVGFDVGVTPIQIGLLLEEGVKVVLTRYLIELPG